MTLKLLMISICITNMFSNKPRRWIKSTIIEHQTSLCKIQVPGSVGKTVGDEVRVIDGASSTVGANFCGRSAASNLFRVTIEHATFVTWHSCSEYFSILDEQLDEQVSLNVKGIQNIFICKKVCIKVVAAAIAAKWKTHLCHTFYLGNVWCVR